jgi:hypothetical protein
MTIRYVSDHVTEGLLRVLSQFDRSPKLRGVVASFLNQVQQLEDHTLDLFYSRTLSGASGAQLDVIGRVVGEPRDGLTDDEYRRFLSVRIAVNFAQGERGRLTDIVALATGSADVHFQPTYPAAFIVSYFTGTPFTPALRARIKALVEAATGSGIGYTIIEANADYFGFAEDDDALGFDEGFFSEII